jgi:hypothetical protein
MDDLATFKAYFNNMDREQILETFYLRDCSLDQARRILAIVPECELHGAGCFPHAEDWIKNQLERDHILTSLEMPYHILE